LQRILYPGIPLSAQGLLFVNSASPKLKRTLYLIVIDITHNL